MDKPFLGLWKPVLWPFAPSLWSTLAVAVLAGGLLVGWFLQQSLSGSARDAMSGLLRAKTESLELWFQQQEAEAESLASLTSITSPASQLLTLDELARAESSRLSIRQPSPEYRELVEQLKASIRAATDARWALFDTGNHVIASNIERLAGQTLAIPDGYWRQLAKRHSAVSHPFIVAGDTWMGAAASIIDGGRPQGALMLMQDPHERFSPLVTSVQLGETGQTFAFDANGLLLTTSRFDPQLRESGLLENGEGVTSMLRTFARQPGANVNEITAEQNAGNRPLTVMADQATRGGTGENLSGYVDFRGVRVIGAWTWLPEYRIGLATETSVAEVYRALHWLRVVKWSLFGLFVSAAAATWFHRSSSRRSDDRVRTTGQLPAQLGQYDLLEIIGRGGMGAVFRATHRLMRRDVAIKILESDKVNPRSLARFQREVQLTAQLHHPNTIEVYDFGLLDDGTMYYVMEFIDGITLQDLVDDFGAQPAERVIHLLRQICGSLSEAHQLGMIHRDIKPSNLLLTPKPVIANPVTANPVTANPVTANPGFYDIIKVLDFGLVKEVDGETADLTRTDGITGTPMYMSPESVRDAGRADERSDLYSVGAVGYTLLTGFPTFDGDSSVDVCLKQLNEEPIRPAVRLGVTLPDDLQNLLMSCLRKDPDERPQTMEDFDAALRQCHDADKWSETDSLLWWNVDRIGRDAKNGRRPTNRNGSSSATGDTGTTTVH